jgi:hypothetical protein
VPKSTRKFDRWKPHDPSTWAHQVYRKYNRELYRLLGAHRSSMAYTYKRLGASGAKWTDLPSVHFSPSAFDLDNFTTLSDWSDAFNVFDNWVNLSTITTLASNIETYIAAVVSLAIDSDPGVLLGAPRKIDGVSILKHRMATPAHLASHVEACTKGDWSSRLAGLEQLFGVVPSGIGACHSAMEEIRSIRNRFGHAFGRDIESSHSHGQIQVAPMEKVTRKTVNRLGGTAWSFVRELDRFLLINHIGDFEAINYYATTVAQRRAGVTAGQRAVDFKKSIGRFGAGLRGKVYCRGLVDYWDAL